MTESTTVRSIDLGTTVCRALMRDMDDKPIRLDVPTSLASGTWPGAGSVYERTSSCGIADQWTVTLIPTLGFVTVTANGQCWGMGLYDQIDIGGVNRIGPQYDYVDYPEDPAQITSDVYVAKLRAVVERALAKVAEDRP